MITRLLIFCLLFFALSCSKPPTAPVGNDAQRLVNPPGTTKVGENFYADINEISNIGYREYLYWLQQVFGDDSPIYRQAQPYVNVWQMVDTMHLGIPADFLPDDYFNNRKYFGYPVVGISLAQAQQYTHWRTDRVAEKQLHRKRRIAVFSKPNKDNFFTLKKYLDGTYDAIVELKEDKFAIYRIPTEEDWERMAGSSSEHPRGIDLTDKFNHKIAKKAGYTFNTHETVLADLNHPPKKQLDFEVLMPGDRMVRNIYGLYHTIGNVAEMIDQEGISKGGSWYHTLPPDPIQAAIIYQGPNAFTGFRNVCSYELKTPVKIE